MERVLSGRLLVAALATALAGCVAPQPPAPRASPAILDAARAAAPAATLWASECTDWDEWEKRAPAFRIHGDSYHVGTCGISAILVAGPEGHVLLDTGTANGSRVVLSNIRVLGFQPENVEYILTSHEHFDHVGGIWWVHQNTGAAVASSAVAAPVIRSGQADPADPQFGMHAPMHDYGGRLLELGNAVNTVTLAGLEFTAIATPGHTPGALTWQWQSCEGADCRTIVYADSLSPVSSDAYRFSDHPAYVQAYRAGLARLAELDCDILLTPHPSASGMRDKLLAGDLSGGMSCREYAELIDTRLSRRLAEEERGQ